MDVSFLNFNELTSGYMFSRAYRFLLCRTSGYRLLIEVKMNFFELVHRHTEKEKNNSECSQKESNL